MAYKRVSDFTVRVKVVEHDSWSGPSVVERLEFDTREEADAWVKDYNQKAYAGDVERNGAKTPETYYRATLA